MTRPLDTTFDASAAESAIARVQADPDAFELIYANTPIWPLTSASRSGSTDRGAVDHDDAGTSNPHIAILDSSFNPPHLAHLAIAASSLPASLGSGESTSGREADAIGVPPYSARLLVFSVRNIEKTPKPGDATVLQRLQMTVLLADALAHTLSAGPGSEGGVGVGVGEGDATGGGRRIPVAVGILNEPTFVGKSRIIHRYLDTTYPSLLARLTFLIGTDTLTRFFEPKFYPDGMEVALETFFAARSRPSSPSRGTDDNENGETSSPPGDGSVLVSARRGTSSADRALEDEVLAGDVAHKWAQRGSVRLLGDGSEGWEEISSTRIRKAVERGDWDEVRALVPGSVADYIQQENLYRQRGADGQ